jgi:3-isopropylmalate/(R)-2-methylmalate dehydratase small subunit
VEPIKYHKGLVYPLNRENVDTDQIIPKQFLKAIERTGFGKYLFYNWRYDDNGNPRPDFTMNDEKYKGASIILAGKNFGCGSSREHAAWSILDYGFKVVIAPSFADIFYNNALKNGILPIKLDEQTIQKWMEKAEKESFTLSVNLEKQTIDDGEQVITFDIPTYHKEKLINGWDDIDLTLLLKDKIEQFEQTRQIAGIN